MAKRIVDALHGPKGSVLISLGDETPMLAADQRHEQAAWILFANSFGPFCGSEEPQAIAGRAGNQALSNRQAVKLFQADRLGEIFSLHAAEARRVRQVACGGNTNRSALGGFMVLNSRREFLVLYWGWQSGPFCVNGRW